MDHQLIVATAELGTEAAVLLDVSHSWFDVLQRLAAAIFCGGLLGIDREAQNKPAGLRTNILVALGSCTFTLLTLGIAAQVSHSDPIRVIDAVVGGIGFLGAATVIRGRRGVEGVTTAATVWVVAGVGVACGLGSYLVAAMATGLGLVTLSMLGFLQNSNRVPANAEPVAASNDESSVD